MLAKTFHRQFQEQADETCPCRAEVMNEAEVFNNMTIIRVLRTKHSKQFGNPLYALGSASLLHFSPNTHKTRCRSFIPSLMIVKGEKGTHTKLLSVSSTWDTESCGHAYEELKH